MNTLDEGAFPTEDRRLRRPPLPDCRFTSKALQYNLDALEGKGFGSVWRFGDLWNFHLAGARVCAMKISFKLTNSI